MPTSDLSHPLRCAGASTMSLLCSLTALTVSTWHVFDDNWHVSFCELIVVAHVYSVPSPDSSPWPFHVRGHSGTVGTPRERATKTSGKVTPRSGDSSKLELAIPSSLQKKGTCSYSLSSLVQQLLCLFGLYIVHRFYRRWVALLRACCFKPRVKLRLTLNCTFFLSFGVRVDPITRV